jgi:hypothetical protein
MRVRDKPRGAQGAWGKANGGLLLPFFIPVIPALPVVSQSLPATDLKSALNGGAFAPLREIGFLVGGGSRKGAKGQEGRRACYSSVPRSKGSADLYAGFNQLPAPNNSVTRYIFPLISIGLPADGLFSA